MPQTAPTENSPQPVQPVPSGWVNRFTGKLVLVLLDNKYGPSLRAGRSLWGLYETLTYRPGDGADTITVPKGFVTDLASIPRWAWIILPPDGPWVKAAIIHDFLYATEGTGPWKGHASGNSRAAPYTRAEADGILREAMENRGVDPVRRAIIWAAVRVGGAGGWKADSPRRRQALAAEVAPPGE
ncbi:DUF1353 domain-containing protein [Roseixanthobacter liquoris]|uniref:DUF1353 domain-containing protein n=1 Tax=Roseixanthobacter liquoris TaxID=3119921 RepID=UPI00372BD9F9